MGVSVILLSLRTLSPVSLLSSNYATLRFPSAYTRTPGGERQSDNPRAMQAFVYRARVATTQSQDKVPLIAARGEAAVVSGHSPLCRASVGIVKPPTEPPRAATRSQVGMP
jgi:hypothetical protein